MKYKQTHPWLSFQLETQRFSPKLWMMLGEAQSKCHHIAGVPLQPETAKELHTIYLTKGVLATTAIEGNTLSEEEVKKQIKGELSLPPSREYLAREVQNIIDACNSIVARLSDTSWRLNLEQICEMNRDVLLGLPGQDHVEPGKIRKVSVGVATYRGAPAGECAHLLRELCDWLNHDSFREDKSNHIAFGLLRAILAHLYIAWIHPFGDGNGRTARLLEFYILISVGVPLPAAHLLSDHYNKTRTEYYRQLQKASETKSPIFFIEYALQGFVDGLVEQFALIKEQQWAVEWSNYIHQHFHNQDSAGDERRRKLVLDLSLPSFTGGVPVAQLKTLTPRLAVIYAGKTMRTLSRDLAYLTEHQLLRMEDGKVKANRELILAFLPRRKPTV